MANKVRIDYLLLDIRELEKKVAGMREAEVYPVSFFSQSFEIAHKILNDLHNLEAEQLEMLSHQMEVHRSRMQSILTPTAQPEEEAPVVEEAAEELHEPEAVAEPYVFPSDEEVMHDEEVTPVDKHEEAEKERAAVSLNDLLGKKNLADLKKAFSLNDHFRFRRELFGSDELKMNQAIADLNNLQTYEDSVVYLQEQLMWDVDAPVVAEFLSFIEKRFL
ncbi:HPt (histidine-containing phosphotransfer) domain-containing protein [Parabacteroides sp. PFB2-12]|uniref:hypothetical protein n=1 Tax=unclassified Parabacteroides TaxID=2649774 RepID=UPI00247703C8|nr:MULTISPECIES: hypothetical protein [unclassified Parabacteroides]MDH6344028.1 HPt (histidine-containing phosphotransfer) domain-containing protein [Parabacteroides sp. PM6-13]MDH6391888.1 HPt (histidine-containing phosphotransfer) domain-containing protein [Parabacteroides sp. PFB2-12]